MSSRSERSQQRKRARELERAMAELDRLDRQHGLGALPTSANRRPPRRRRYPAAVTLLASAVVVTAVVAFAPTAEMQALRRVIGLGGDRLEAAPAVPDGSGHYKFLQTQPQTHEPVGYDPCRAIQVEVNPAGAPEGYDRLVDAAIAHTSDATGLQFERVGTTDRRPPDRVSSQRGPVLIAWADADEVPDLKGDVAGIGGSTAVETGFRHREYVTGTIVLDSDVFDDVRGDEYAPAQAIVDHEFGHLVGLDHVNDRGELMNPENVGRTTYGPGDLEGLARIGNVPCD